ncbi:hypothetical protein D3C77_308670 [compost metagenome]
MVFSLNSYEAYLTGGWQMNSKISLRWCVLVVVVIVGGYVGYYIFLYSGFPSQGWSELKGVRSGTFGDAFGALNALFSGLAFSGVLITLLLQRNDMKEAKEQNFKQQVESRFYSLLSLQQNIVQSFDLHHGEGGSQVVYSGRDCFRVWSDFFRKRYNASNDISLHLSEKARVVQAYKALISEYRGDLGLYFRSLHSIFLFIYSSDQVEVDKSQYALVLRSFLSDFELVVLFYNCIAGGGANFSRFAKKYALFENLDIGLLADVKHISLVGERAFGGNQEALKLLNSKS